MDTSANRWYDSSAGLVPQIIVLTVIDVFFLALTEFFAFMGMMLRRLQGSWLKYAQISINACHEPPEFTLAFRYSYMIKISAAVLVFAPAAPVLYFVGGERSARTRRRGRLDTSAGSGRMRW